jgi:hypothetical protein
MPKRLQCFMFYLTNICYFKGRCKTMFIDILHLIYHDHTQRNVVYTIQQYSSYLMKIWKILDQTYLLILWDMVWKERIKLVSWLIPWEISLSIKWFSWIDVKGNCDLHLSLVMLCFHKNNTYCETKCRYAVFIKHIHVLVPW